MYSFFGKTFPVEISVKISYLHFIADDRFQFTVRILQPMFCLVTYYTVLKAYKLNTLTHFIPLSHFYTP